MPNLFSYDFDRVTRLPPEEYLLDVGVVERGLLSRKLLIVDIESTGLDTFALKKFIPQPFP